MTGLYAIFIFVGVGLAVAVLLFNRLVSRRQMVRNAWADIDVQLKRRSELIPQLVSTVKGYAAHEAGLFAEIAERRAQAMNAGGDPAARASAETALSQPVGRLLAVAEDYPDLKANENFLELQKELSDTEEKIEMSRRFYNGSVRDYNIATETFPGNLVSGMFGFKAAEFFEASMTDRQLPQVDRGDF